MEQINKLEEALGNIEQGPYKQLWMNRTQLVMVIKYYRLAEFIKSTQRSFRRLVRGRRASPGHPDGPARSRASAHRYSVVAVTSTVLFAEALNNIQIAFPTTPSILPESH
ncbi:MAG: hypothetical protein R2778_05840 [Saprospiraceae bacterium]